MQSIYLCYCAVIKCIASCIVKAINSGNYVYASVLFSTVENKTKENDEMKVILILHNLIL